MNVRPDPERSPVPQDVSDEGVAALVRRQGWTCRVPARHAIERDEAAVVNS
ncbi:winged helix-turn-helix domain-containing protein [Streptomyces sp. NPDC088354]|uniref:winged helix-turn-helix domain-containing protein n=1 Tax=Streptomyces sp. NPDC088354 TaxID=3365856 RepID=UPI0037FA56A1